jgi:hypothetical protein
VGKNGAVKAVTDGLLGLGRGSITLLSQLKRQGITKNVLGHCLSTSGGGFLFFGDDMVPTSRVTWVPMAPSSSGYALFSRSFPSALYLSRMFLTCDTEQIRPQLSLSISVFYFCKIVALICLPKTSGIGIKFNIFVI